MNRQISQLEAQGFEILKIANLWVDDNNPYRSVNVRFVSVQGQETEIQYYTKEGFALKNGEMQDVYRMWKMVPADSMDAIELQNKMFALGRQIQIPSNISEVRKI